jgi:hypothetical protein
LSKIASRWAQFAPSFFFWIFILIFGFALSKIFSFFYKRKASKALGWGSNPLYAMISVRDLTAPRPRRPGAKFITSEHVVLYAN